MAQGDQALRDDEVQRAHGEAARRASEERNAFLLQLSDALRPLIDPVEIQTVALRILAGHLGLSRAAYWEILDDQDRTRKTAGFDGDLPPVPSATRISDFSADQLACYLAGRAFVVSDTETDPRVAATRDACRAIHVRAWVGVPLVKGGKLLIVLGVEKAAPHAWTDGEVRLLEEAAERTWAASERGRTEAALRESEARLRLFGDASTDVLWIRDAATLRWTYLSPAFDQVYRRTRESVLGPDDLHAWVDLVVPEDRQMVRGMIERVRRGERVTFEYRIQGPDGTIRWVRDTDFPSRDADDVVRQIGGIGRDVTHEKHIDATLRESEERQAFLLELTDAVGPLLDPAEITARISEAVGRQLEVARCGYGEVPPPYDRFVVARDWTNGIVPSLKGAWPIERFDEQLVAQSRAGKTVVVEDAITGDEREAGVTAVGTVRSGIAVPLIKGGQLVAAFYLHDTAPRHWTPGEIALTEEVARRIWATVERGRAEQALRRSEQKYRTLFESIDEGFCILELIYDEHDRATDYRYVEVNQSFERQTGLRDALGRLGSEIVSYTEPSWFDAYDRVVRTGEPLRLENFSQGTGRWYEAYVSRVGDAGSRLVCAVFSDITERKRRERQQAYVLQLSDALAPLVDSLAIARTALQVLRAQLGAARAVYAEAIDEEGTMRIFAESLEPGLARMDGLVLRFADFTPGAFAEALSGRPLWREDVLRADHTREQQNRYRALGTRAWAMIPQVKEGRLIALLTVHVAEPRAWTAEELALIRETVERTWAAVARARAEQALQQAHDLLEARVRERTAEVQSLFGRLVSGQEEERRRIARDMHDQLGQQMTALRMNLEMLAHGFEDDAAFRVQLTRTQHLAEELDRSIDFLTWDLRPAALDHLGLAAALEHLVTGWSERFGIPAAFDAGTTDALRLPSNVEANIYRLTQEALHNIVKHAQATQVAVSLQRRRHHLLLVIEDNGRGFSSPEGSGAGSSGGLGLVSMRERGALIGGTVDIESAPNQGTTIFVRVPITTGERQS